MIKRLQTITLSIVIAAFMLSCGGNDDSQPAPEPDNTVHKLTYYDYQLSPPNKVNVVFQLNDQDAMPLGLLTSAEITLQEDAADLNSAENNFELESNDFDYLPYVALVIDLNSDTDSVLEDLKAAANEILGSLPANTQIALYTFSSSVRNELDFTSDAAEVALAINDLASGNQGANLYRAITTALGDLSDLANYGAGSVSPGVVVAITASEDTEGASDIDEINDELGNNRVFSFTIGETADSAFVGIINHAGVTAVSADEISDKADELEGLLEAFESSIYVFSYTTLREGTDEVSVSLTTLKAETGEDIEFTYTPSLFFNPDSFEIKTDELRFVSDGSRRNGEVLVRMDMRNDSVDFQLFSGFEPSRYDILFVERDPAIFGDWNSLRNDPDAIPVRIESSDFVLDEGFQSDFQDPEIFNRKYMVIRDFNNRSDLSYIQMTLQ